MMSINPDAHSVPELDHMHWGVEMARKGGVPPDRILNGQAETPLGDRQKHHAPIRGQAPAIKGCCDFLGLNGWK